MYDLLPDIMVVSVAEKVREKLFTQTNFIGMCPSRLAFKGR